MIHSSPSLVFPLVSQCFHRDRETLDAPPDCSRGRHLTAQPVQSTCTSTPNSLVRSTSTEARQLICSGPVVLSHPPTTVVMSGIAVGLKKGFIVTKRVQKQKASRRKGVRKQHNQQQRRREHARRGREADRVYPVAPLCCRSLARSAAHRTASPDAAPSSMYAAAHRNCGIGSLVRPPIAAASPIHARIRIPCALPVIIAHPPAARRTAAHIAPHASGIGTYRLGWECGIRCSVRCILVTIPLLRPPSSHAIVVISHPLFALFRVSASAPSRFAL